MIDAILDLLSETFKAVAAAPPELQTTLLVGGREISRSGYHIAAMATAVPPGATLGGIVPHLRRVRLADAASMAVSIVAATVIAVLPIVTMVAVELALANP